MGLEIFGYPSEIVDWLAKRMNLNVFVEAGTFHGASAVQASRVFHRVITIEKSNFLFNEANSRLIGYSNISCYNGCTRDHVVEHLRENDNPLFWLDAHWSGGETSGREDECPIKDELVLIFSLKIASFAILIDDARLFTSPPPKPHDKNQWPRIDEIAKLLPDNCAMYIFNDVIYILPSCVSNDFSTLIQEGVSNELNLPNKGKRRFVDTVKKFFRSSLARLLKRSKDI